MFTGIVEERGEIVALEFGSNGVDGTVSTPAVPADSARLTVRGPKVTSDVHHGDSIAVSGICLTVVASGDGTFTADLMNETLERTSARHWAPGASVNLERSVPAGGRLGGHVVQGHVDGVARIIAREPADQWEVVRFSLPPELARYVVEKGSITVDGVSLTVMEVTADSFAIGMIPATSKLAHGSRTWMGSPFRKAPCPGKAQ